MNLTMIALVSEVYFNILLFHNLNCYVMKIICRLELVMLDNYNFEKICSLYWGIDNHLHEADFETEVC